MMLAIDRALRRPLTLGVSAIALVNCLDGSVAEAGDIVRFATFNASMNRLNFGDLRTALEGGTDMQIQTVTEIIQRANPDILLINEFDYDPMGPSLPQLFLDNYLSQPQNVSGQRPTTPINYDYTYWAPANTGIHSGFDLDNNGSVVATPGAAGYGGDALGFGNFPGQFGMAVFSKHQIQVNEIRTFQNFLWKDMPGARLPVDPTTGTPWYSDAELDELPLSSKSHWDIPVTINGEVVHFLTSHPTPPVFDGAEDRNGLRNFDEIRFWADYIAGADYIYDDNGNFGGLDDGEKFVIAGDQNADPFDGDSTDDAILQLLENPQINTDMPPSSEGAEDASDRLSGVNVGHVGDPAEDTAQFNPAGPGNLRVDYVLPSENLEIVDSGVFWPVRGTDVDPVDPLWVLVGDFPFPSSDHRLVYADVHIPVPPGLPVLAFCLLGLGLINRQCRRS